MERFTCSSGPMNSMPPYSRFLTGLTNLAGVEARKMPQKNFSLMVSPCSPSDELDFVLLMPKLSLNISFDGKKAISSVFGTHR